MMNTTNSNMLNLKKNILKEKENISLEANEVT